MPRAARTWTTMLAEIRQMLRETVAADSYWTDPNLLDYANQAVDLRVMQLAEQHEGWVTDRYEANLVANQREYTLPVGTGRVKRVLFQWNPGATNQYEIPLNRHERYGEAMYTQASGVGQNASVPTYRILGELVYLEPPSTVARTDGLVLEVEAAPARLVNGDSTLAARFPDVMETLIVYDVWNVALGVEESRGLPAPDEAAMDRLTRFHRLYEGQFEVYTAVRSFGPSFSVPMYLGD